MYIYEYNNKSKHIKETLWRKDQESSLQQKPQEWYMKPTDPQHVKNTTIVVGNHLQCVQSYEIPIK